MSRFQTWRKFRQGLRTWWVVPVAYLCLLVIVRAAVPAPDAVGIEFDERPATGLRFAHDDSWLDAAGSRQLEQLVFEDIFSLIKRAERFILLDMFLFNDWQGPVKERQRALSSELTQALLARKAARPNIVILVISDPINTVYGGLESSHFTQLRAAGMPVTLSDLSRLQDSNPLWTGIWRWFVRPFGNSTLASTLPNPLGDGRVSIRSYLALLNFKANHRKLMVVDDGGNRLLGIVSSANPHDGSSAHRNVSLQFTGPAVNDLLASERRLLLLSGANESVELLDTALHDLRTSDEPTDYSLPTLKVISESAIRDSVVDAIDGAMEGDSIDLAMFYLSERSIIEALKRAHLRGASLRLLLDINQDAFGRKKNGVPNRPVAAELVKSGIDVRWCATRGEQCHAKWLHVESVGEHVFIMGSANFTRRNLLDLNLETDVQLRTSMDDPAAREMLEHFDHQWNNSGNRTYSYEYEKFSDDSLWLSLQYRFMEFSGLSTF